MTDEGMYQGFPTAFTVEAPKDASKSDQIIVKFTVGNVANGGEWQPCTPFERTIYMSCSPAAWPYSEKKLALLGITRDNQDLGEDAKVNGVTLRCYHDDYQGKTKEKWDIYTPVKELKPLDDAGKSRLRSLFGAAAPKPVGRPVAPGKAPAKFPSKAPAPVATQDLDPADIPY